MAAKVSLTHNLKWIAIVTFLLAAPALFLFGITKKVHASSVTYDGWTAGFSGANCAGDAEYWVAVRVYLRDSVTGLSIPGDFTVSCKYDSISGGLYYEGPDANHRIFPRWGQNCTSPGPVPSGTAVCMGSCALPFWLSASAAGYNNSDADPGTPGDQPWLVNHEVSPVENTLYPEGNANTANYTVYLDPIGSRPSLPDVVLAGGSFSPVEPTGGYNPSSRVTYNYTVKNEGNPVFRDFEVSFCADGTVSACNRVVRRQTINCSPAAPCGTGWSYSSSFSFFTSSTAGNYNLEVWADDPDTVGESRENNNNRREGYKVGDPAPWMKTKDGNVGSKESIAPTAPVPTTASLFLPERLYNASYLLIAAADITNFSSSKGWRLPNYDTGLGTDSPQPLVGVGFDYYNWLYNKFRTKIVPWTRPNELPGCSVAAGCFYEYSGGSFTIGPGTRTNPGPEPVVFFIPGTLHFNRLDISAGRPMIYVVRDDVRTNVSITRSSSLGCALLGEASGCPIKSHVQNTFFFTNGGLFLNNGGGLYIIKGAAIANEFSFGGDMREENSRYPAEYFIYDPSILWYFRNTIGVSKTTVRELAP